MSMIRIEYVRLRPGGDEGALSPSVIDKVAAAATEEAAPAAWGVVAVVPALDADRAFSGGVVARVIALQGAAMVGVGAADRGILVSQATGPVYLPVKAGQMVSAVDASTSVYRLASALAALAAGERSAPISGIAQGAYAVALTATFPGGSSLKLQQIGPDGATWMDAIDLAGSAATFTAPGMKGVFVGAEAVLSLLAVGGTVENINALAS